MTLGLGLPNISPTSHRCSSSSSRRRTRRTSRRWRRRRRRRMIGKRVRLMSIGDKMKRAVV